MSRYGYDIRVDPKAAASAAVDLFDLAETKAIRELAAAVHKDGMQFDGWPKIEHVRLVFGQEGLREADERDGYRVDMWRVSARVIGVPRTP